MRKILVIIAGFVGILLIGGLVYVLINRPTTSSTAGPETNALSAEQQPTGQLRLLSKELIFDYWLASSTQEIFYISQNGKVAKINSGQDIVLSEQLLENIQAVLPSPDNQKIIVAFGNPSQPQFSIFDLVNKSWTPLSLNIKAAAWSPESKRLAVLINQNDITNLAIIPSATGTPKTILKNFSLKDLNIDWRLSDEIIFTDKPSYLINGSVWRLGLSKLNFDEIISPGAGLLVKWVSNDLGLKFQNQKSSLINWAGKVINNISFMVLPDKCVLKSDSLYCFLFTPTNLKTNWPDDYLQKNIYTKDNLYKIDLNNLTAPKIIFDSAAKGKTIDSSRVKVFGDQILFINRYDNQLYGLEIVPTE